MRQKSCFYVKCLDAFTNESIHNYLMGKRGFIPKQTIVDSQKCEHLVYEVECRDVEFFQRSKGHSFPLIFNVFRIRGDGLKGAERWIFHLQQNI